MLKDKLKYGLFGAALGLLAGFTGVAIADQTVNDNFVATGSLHGGNNVRSGYALGITAGGNVTGNLCMTATPLGACVMYGSGAPTVTAAKGSLYLRSDGSSTSTRLYVNSDGATTWVAVTTAS